MKSSRSSITLLQGGDIFYRWGNPLAYNQGEASDKKLGKLHDAQWVTSTGQEGGRIMIFNNIFVNGIASALYLIDVPINGDGGYMITDSVYGPITLSRSPIF